MKRKIRKRRKSSSSSSSSSKEGIGILLGKKERENKQELIGNGLRVSRIRNPNKLGFPTHKSLFSSFFFLLLDFSMAADSDMGFWREVLRTDSLACFGFPSNVPAGGGGAGGDGNPVPTGPSSSNAAAAEPVAGAKEEEEGLSEEWTLDEQTILNRALIKYVCEHGTRKYIKVASELPRKTVRDVAKRCRRLSRRHDNAKRPRVQFALNRMNDRKEKMVEPCSNANIPMVPPGNISSYSPMVHQVNQNDQFSFQVLDDATQQLMDRNMQILGIISSNLAACKIQENIDLFRLAKEDIETVLLNMSNMPGKMGLMPPLPVSVNEGLLNDMIMSQTQTVFPLPGFPGFHSEQQPGQPRYDSL